MTQLTHSKVSRAEDGTYMDIDPPARKRKERDQEDQYQHQRHRRNREEDKGQDQDQDQDREHSRKSKKTEVVSVPATSATSTVTHTTTAIPTTATTSSTTTDAAYGTTTAPATKNDTSYSDTTSARATRKRAREEEPRKVLKADGKKAKTTTLTPDHSDSSPLISSPLSSSSTSSTPAAATPSLSVTPAKPPSSRSSPSHPHLMRLRSSSKSQSVTPTPSPLFPSTATTSTSSSSAASSSKSSQKSQDELGDRPVLVLERADKFFLVLKPDNNNKKGNAREGQNIRDKQTKEVGKVGQVGVRQGAVTKNKKHMKMSNPRARKITTAVKVNRDKKYNKDEATQASRLNEPNHLDGTSAARSEHAMITAKDHGVDDRSDNNGINTMLDAEVRDWIVNGLAEHLTATTMVHGVSHDNHNAEAVMRCEEVVLAESYRLATIVLNNYYPLHSGASNNNGNGNANTNSDNPHISNYFRSYRQTWLDALNLSTVSGIYSRTNNNNHSYSAPTIGLKSTNSYSSSSSSEPVQPALTFVRTPLNSRLEYRNRIHTNNDIIAPRSMRSKENIKAYSTIEAQQRASLSFVYRGAQRASETNSHGSISSNTFHNSRDSYNNNILVNSNNGDKIVSEENTNTASNSTSTMTRSYSTLDRVSTMHSHHELQDENTLGNHYSHMSADITQSKFPIQKQEGRRPFAPIDTNIHINTKAHANSTGANSRSIKDNSHSDMYHGGMNALQANNGSRYSGSRQAL